MEPELTASQGTKTEITEQACPDPAKQCFEYQLDFLKLEYGAINEAIGRIDETTAKIKNWALITWAGSIAIALREQRLTDFLWMTAVPPVLFFFVDGWWRRIQRTLSFGFRKSPNSLTAPN